VARSAETAQCLARTAPTMDGVLLAGAAGRFRARAAWGPVSSGPSRWSFSERGLHRSLRAVLGAVPVRPLAEIPAPIADLVWILAQGIRRNLGIATILRAVQDGTLPAFRTRPTVQLCDLWFTCAVATAYLDATRCRRRQHRVARREGTGPASPLTTTPPAGLPGPARGCASFLLESPLVQESG